jgi:hypothetical protein
VSIARWELAILEHPLGARAEIVIQEEPDFFFLRTRVRGIGQGPTIRFVGRVRDFEVAVLAQ